MKKRGRQFRRLIDPMAAFHAVAMNHGLDASQQTDLGVALRVSVEALRTGKADETAFHTIAAAVNVSLVLAERGTGAEHSAIIRDAQEGLIRLWRRGKKTGRWVMDGAGLQATMQAIELHEAQLAAVTRKEAADAMREVKRRILRGQVFDEQKAAA